MEAVNSALNQTLQKEHFEIFVIKNFVNEEIDLFLNKHLIRNFYDPSPYWNVSLSNVLANATGDVICFLDDDDIFVEHKLEVLCKIFESDDLLFVKDGTIHFERDDKKPQYRRENSEGVLFYLSADGKLIGPPGVLTLYNNSSMSISRPVLESYLRRLNDSLPKNGGCRHSLDNFLIFTTIEAGKGLVLSNKLTYYREHAQQITANYDDTETYYDKKILMEKTFLESYEAMRFAFQHHIILNRIDDMILQSRFQIILLSKTRGPFSTDLPRKGIEQYLKYHEKIFIFFMSLYFLKLAMPNTAANIFRLVLKNYSRKSS